MTLRVTEDDLDSYGKMVKRAGSDALDAQQYVAKYCRIDTPAQGLFIEAFNIHGSLVPKVENVFKRLHTLLDSSATELKDSATYYRKTDLKHAASMDATLPETKR
ncbi:hypothetical protein [Streptomyces sp. 11-1-2]|uniref:hypothetical protein n=1 Tax=unclassified Streptomyces TaxID=2593676 RepID=UPI000B8D443B|nr:hypothetical protein [Streptomyces sp. 11-1-2]ASQ97286.1 hypothetical protein CGL27_33415 [Streptomyces sp. 11-1-2]